MKSLVRLLVVLLVGAGLSLTSMAQELKPQKFLLTFVPNIQFSPVYVGIAQGYFADAGLDLSLEYLNEPDVLDLIAAGQEQFGIVSGEQVILAASQERPIVYVYEWFQKYPIGIVYNAATEIDSIEDLQGLRVGIPGRFGASYTGLTALLLAAGMTESDIDLQEIGYNAPEVFCIGAVDAAVVYINNEPLQIRNRAQAGECGSVQEIGVLPVSDNSDVVSNGILTSQALIDSDPDLVRGLVGAFDRSVRDVINNPARAYLLSASLIEDLPLSDDLRASLETLADEQDTFLATEPDREAIATSRQSMLVLLQTQYDSADLIQFEVLLATIDLWDADQVGFSGADSWESTQDTLMAMGLLEGKINLDLVYTTNFLPEVSP
jgi:NitT/TauT family transport system substrate-binding protein